MSSSAAKKESVSSELLAVRDGALQKIRSVTDNLEPVLQPAFAEIVTQAIDQEDGYKLTTEQNGRIVTESALGGKVKRTIYFESNQKIRVVFEDARDEERSGGLKINALMGPPDFNDEYHLEYTGEGSVGSCMAFSGANYNTYIAMARVGMGFKADFRENRLIRKKADEGFGGSSTIHCGQNDYPNGQGGNRFDREVRQNADGSIYFHVFEAKPDGLKIHDQQVPSTQ